MFHSHRGRSPQGRRSHHQAQSRPHGRRVEPSARAISGSLLIRDFLEYLGSPRALSVWMLYSAGEHRQLVELSLDPHNYNDAESFKRDFAAVKFLSKMTGLRTGIDLKAVAIKSAEEAELQCSETNHFLRSARSGHVRHVSGLESQVFHQAKAKIAAILGPVPADFREVGWSKGRTTSVWGEKLSSLYKYGARPDVTASALRYAVRTVRDSHLWGSAVLDADGPVSVLPRAFTVVDGNVMLTVPKTAKTDRVICYEPHMNIRLQLSVGSFIRARLKRFGVNLDDQSVNQRRAALGARHGNLCTIDLRAASDTVAIELVHELLPIDWVCLLEDLRSKYTRWPDGSVRKNEKFSSMGNGFTFELESLLFYAVCSAVTSGVSVYGDDIVLPTESFDLAVMALQMCGFTINLAKSYSSSYFRESCGANAFGGVSVTPVYLRALPKSLEDVVLLHNQVRAWALQNHQVGDRALASLLRKWRDIHPHPCGPRGYGDGHYHTNFDEATPRRATHQVDGWQFTTYIRRFDERAWGDDRLSGRIPERLGFAALCSATGPKRPRSLWDTGADRRRGKWKKHKGLCHFEWPDGLWC
jgi:hypothetical protein